MYRLCIHAALLDDLADMMDAVRAESALTAICVALVILLAALTMMNMLVGVLCEVMSSVAATEKEELAVSLVRSTLQQILRDTGLDTFKDGKICKGEFAELVQRPEAVIALKE